MNDFEYLRNDAYAIWLRHPGLTAIETIDLLRKRRLLDRPQKGLKEALMEMKIDFYSTPTREPDVFDSLPTDSEPIGSNPFMTDFE